MGGEIAHVNENVDDSVPIVFFREMGHATPEDSFIPAKLSAEAAQKEATLRSRRIWKNWHSLNAILKRHEATIQKRWRKKSVQSRRELLLSAWPDMPLPHRPDLYALRREAFRTDHLPLVEAKDQIWPFREDPGYFEECIIELKEHGMENIPDANGHLHPALKHSQRHDYWSRLLGNFISTAYLLVELWNHLHEQVHRLSQWQVKYKSRISTQKELPKDYSIGLLYFMYSLERCMAISTLGNPEGGKFFYPVDKSATKDNTNAMIRAESNLDLFWGTVDRHTMNHNGTKFKRTAVGRLLAGPRMLQRTPEWVETKKENRVPVTLNKREIPIEPMSSIFLNNGQQLVKELSIDMTKKPKEKTRGVPRSPKAGDRPERVPTLTAGGFTATKIHSRQEGIQSLFNSIP
ncbi:hypothetical protein B9Z65_2864 [Elsinoe australis]|uniref:Uncharacterized protein n=1 Tax=Elsinoe australis TaxID=40998 RepID=A0A2P7ZTP6_9PEZI|nr:hypothetical protein B9Z65_2864 [Elsinoe australis]